MTRHYYLEDIPMDEARSRLWAALEKAGRAKPVSGEWVSLAEALGRVTAEAVWAKISSPHYHAAAVDGFAVLASDTLDATETRPVSLKIGQQAIPVNTGEPIPAPMNAVIMIEHVQQPDETQIIIRSSVAPWQHVRMMGEDMVATELVLPANHKIRPVDLGAIAGSGHHQVMVRRAPFVVIIPTGTELIPPTQTPQPGQIIEYNSLVLGGQIQEIGGKTRVMENCPDDPICLKEALENALAQQPDLILMLSGSSAGSKDFTANLIRDMGELLVHGVAVRPGHPVIMGMVNEIPVTGVPGYPVSAALTGEIFIQPLIAAWLGQQSPLESRPRMEAISTRKITSPAGDDDFMRVAVAEVHGKWLAAPLNRGAGVITSLVRADGLAHIPRFSEGLDMGQPVEVILYHTPRELKNTLLIMGSHDPMIDLLAQHVSERFPGFRISSVNVGSLGGLIALKRQEAHLAGIHLLDEETGTYNFPYLEKYLPGTAYQLITFAHREQGLLVLPGNPKGIHSIADLPNHRYVNRQRGAGTRLLLDYELKRLGISPETITGYEREEYTHLGVAVAVKTGVADCGLGVRSAAIALELDFIPVGWERYDFVIPESDAPALKPFLEVLQSESFRQALAAQPGYETSETGRYRLTPDIETPSMK